MKANIASSVFIPLLLIFTNIVEIFVVIGLFGLFVLILQPEEKNEIEG